MNKIPKDNILPTDTLLVGFDFTHGEEHKVLIVGKKQGKMLTIVNAFEGAKAEEIFKLLTTIEGGTDE